MALKELFTDIADAIREKEGTTDAIKATDFPERISNISSGSSISDDITPTNVVDGKWIRPDSWQDIESIELPDDDSSVLYLLYGAAMFELPYISIYCQCNSGYYHIQKGHVDNGEFISDGDVTNINTGTKYQEIITDSTQTVVYKIWADNNIIGFRATDYSYNNNTLPGTAQPLLMRYGSCPYLTSLFMTSGGCSIYLESDNIKNCKSLTALNLAYSSAYSLKRFRHDGWDTSKVTTFSSMFNQCYQLVDIDKDFSGWVTENATTLQNMFYSCYALKEINCSDWDTKNLISLQGMFYSCRSLTRIIGIEDWYLPNAPTIADSSSGMFNSCTSLFQNDGKMDLSNWHYGENSTTNKYFNSLFSYCRTLKEINLSNWNLGLSLGFQSSFQYCYSLESILINDNTILPSANCKTLNSMYLSDFSLKTPIPFTRTKLDGTKDGWDLSNMINMCNIFSNCNALPSIDMSGVSGIPSGTTNNSQTSWFYYCYSLRDLDLSGIDLSNMTYSTSQYANWVTACMNLVNFNPPINISKNFNISSCRFLTRESLLKIIENLLTVTTTTTLTLGVYNKAKLTDDELAMITDKGWTIA